MYAVSRTYSGLARRHALRRLRHDWGNTLIAVLSLSLGAALVAVTMAWLDGALERDFGYLEAERLWQVQILDSQVAASIDADFGALVQSSRRVIDEFSSRQNGFTAVGMGRPLTLTLVHEGREEDAPAFVVDDAFFPVLGVRVEQGRMPEPGRPEVVLESSFAKARFGSSAHAIGQVVDAGGKAYRVVGTLPERFVHPAPASIRRVPGLTPVVYVAAQESQFADTAENAQFLLIGRSELDFRALRASVTRALSMVGSDSGSAVLTPILRPLTGWVAGDGAALASRLLLLTGLLLVSVLITAVGASAIRARMQAREHALLEVLGASGGRAFRFTASESTWITLGMLVAGIAIFALLCALARLNPQIGMPITPRFLRVGGLVLLGECALALALLRLIVRAQSRTGGTLVHTRGAARFQLGSGVLRALVTLQACIILLLLGSALGFSEYSLQTIRNSLSVDTADLYEVRIQRRGAHAARLVAMEARRIKQAAIAQPGVVQGALLSSPPLDLIGLGVTYRGPREVFGRIVGRSDGAVIVAMDDVPARDKSDFVTYQASIIRVEAAYFEMMGFPLLAGHVFDDDEDNVAILTPELDRLMFPDQDPVGSRIPASPLMGDSDVWHNGLVVAGVVDAKRVGGVSMLGRIFSHYPIAFVPYSDRFPGDVGQPATASLLLQSSMDRGEVQRWLESVSLRLREKGYSVQTHRLADQVRERAVQHLLASLLGLAIISIVMLSAALGSMSGMRLLCSFRRGEIAIRMALGEPEHRIAARFVLHELFWPVVAASVLSVLLLLLPESLLPLPLHGSVGMAWGLVLLSLLVGVVPPLYRVLAESPARALQSE